MLKVLSVSLIPLALTLFFSGFGCATGPRTGTTIQQTSCCNNSTVVASGDNSTVECSCGAESK